VKQEQQVEHANGVDVPGDQALCVSSERGPRGQAFPSGYHTTVNAGTSGSMANRSCGRATERVRLCCGQV
jgi:hypothetical protein